MSAKVGYPRLARLMSLEPQTAIFRRFNELTILNLLRLQAELHCLEEQLEEIREEDALSNDPIRTKYVHDFRLMRDWIEDGDSLQHDILVNIGEKLQEYHTALSNAFQTSKAGAPTKSELRFLDIWLKSVDGGNNFLSDLEDTIWSLKNKEDLITLCSRHPDHDILTSMLNGVVLNVYNGLFGKHRKVYRGGELGETIRGYNDEHVLQISKVISATLSSLLPTIAILILFFVKRMLVRIGLVIVFTAIFSLTLSIFTEARKVEIFSATAAFAAVEVVFVGSTAMDITDKA